MIRSVSFDGTTYNDLPHKFEAGTPHISGGIALGIALDWMNGVGTDAIAAHERALVDHAHAALGTLPAVRIIGTAPEKVGVLSLVVDGLHPYDLGTLLDGQGIAVRTDTIAPSPSWPTSGWIPVRCGCRLPPTRPAKRSTGPSLPSNAPCAC